MLVALRKTVTAGKMGDGVGGKGPIAISPSLASEDVDLFCSACCGVLKLKAYRIVFVGLVP